MTSFRFFILIYHSLWYPLIFQAFAKFFSYVYIIFYVTMLTILGCKAWDSISENMFNSKLGNGANKKLTSGKELSLDHSYITPTIIGKFP